MDRILILGFQSQIVRMEWWKRLLGLQGSFRRDPHWGNSLVLSPGRSGKVSALSCWEGWGRRDWFGKVCIFTSGWGCRNRRWWRRGRALFCFRSWGGLAWEISWWFSLRICQEGRDFGMFACIMQRFRAFRAVGGGDPVLHHELLLCVWVSLYLFIFHEKDIIMQVATWDTPKN